MTERKDDERKKWRRGKKNAGRWKSRTALHSDLRSAISKGVLSILIKRFEYLHTGFDRSISSRLFHHRYNSSNTDKKFYPNEFEA